jgi:ATP-dependent DNA helicase RecQ
VLADPGIEIRDDEFDREPQAPGPAAPGFEVGARVRVHKYDEGVVVAVAGEQVTIEFPGQEQRTFLAGFVEQV